MRRRGAEEAGAIFIKINRLDGTARFTGRRRRRRSTRRSRPTGCLPLPRGKAPAPDADIEARLVKEIRFDPDVWIIEVEDRTGRNFIDGVVK